MSPTTSQSIDTGAAIVAKAAPPVTVSLATVAGIQVNELLLWATLIYTILMIGHKLYSIVHDVAEKRRLKAYRASHVERRVGMPDERPVKSERRATVPKEDQCSS